MDPNRCIITIVAQALFLSSKVLHIMIYMISISAFEPAAYLYNPTPELLQENQPREIIEECIRICCNQLVSMLKESLTSFTLNLFYVGPGA